MNKAYIETNVIIVIVVCDGIFTKHRIIITAFLIKHNYFMYNVNVFGYIVFALLSCYY